MHSRIASKADIKAIRKMWDEFYGYSTNFTQWFFNRAFYSQNSLVVCQDSQLIASSGFIPHKMNLNNDTVDCAYIAGFVTLPEYRSESTEKQLLADTLLSINDRDIPISLIVPHSYKFYEKYGFSTCYSFKQYNITPDDIPAFTIKGSIERHKISDTVIDALNTVYEEYTSDMNATLLRNEENWKLILEDLIGNFGGKIAILKDEENNPSGYMLYVLKNGHFAVYEMAYTTRKAYEGLMAYIKAHDVQVTKITIKAPVNDLSYLDFCDSRNTASICPFVMARINNVRNILEYLSKDFSGNVRLQIIDRLIEDNNRTFAISNSEVIKIDTDCDVATDVGTLAMLVLGYISIEEAKKLNLISGDSSLLKGLFEKKNNYINMLCF